MTPTPADLPNFDSLVPGGITPLPLTASKGEKPQHPRPMGSALTASAQRITRKTISRIGSRVGKDGASSWQADAGDAYDLVGELRFLANVLAGRAARAHLFVGTLNHDDPLADPEPTDDPVLQSILDAFGKNTVGRSQMLLRMLINQFIGGEGYFVGVPPKLMPDYEPEGERENVYDGNRLVITQATDPLSTATALDEVTLEQLQWHMLSPTEVRALDSDRVRLTFSTGDKIEVSIDDVFLIQVMRSHPLRGWEPDSPTRSNLPVLRELIGLTMAISGQIDSRLAGAGILAIAQAVSEAAKRTAAERGEEVDEDDDPIMDVLMDAMSTAIENRASASSFTPIGVLVPDGTKPSEAFHHYTFDNPLDKEYVKLREEAIRRFALGSDAPPELLLGVGGMNHWGAWLVREDVVTAHIEPPLALVCDAITTQYLRAAMRATGDYSEQQIDDTVVWYDVSHLITNPNRGADATELYDRGELSGEALRAARGFDENDAPESPIDPIVRRALDMVATAPQLLQAPGLTALVEQIRAAIEGRTISPVEVEVTEDVVEDTPEDVDTTGDTEGGPPQEGAPEFALQASAIRRRRTNPAALVAADDEADEVSE